jgi:hypothetical protein
MLVAPAFRATMISPPMTTPRVGSLPRLILATVFAAVVVLPRATTAAATRTTPAVRPGSAAPAWEPPPGWTQTRGGEDGRVFRVTTLAGRGAGSLAAALGATGPRKIEFTVAGVIDLGGRSLGIASPHVTIAGETAPSPGITITNGGITISTHDVVVRHIRIRPGAGNREKKSGWEVDGLATGGGARDVIVDHCSITWATDENLSASGPRFQGASPDEWRRNTSHRITFSHCIIGEGLHDSTHAKGPHSMGSLIHDNASDIAIIGNLYISNNARNPLFKGGARGAIVNNLIHNPGRMIIAYGLVPQEWQDHEWQQGAMVVVGNVARKGPSTAAGAPFLQVRGPCEVYLHDNLFFDQSGEALEARAEYRDPRLPFSAVDVRGELALLEAAPQLPPRLEPRPASETMAWVLANAGARPWDRDAIDRRLIEEAGSGGGKIIDSEHEVGGVSAGR